MLLYPMHSLHHCCAPLIALHILALFSSLLSFFALILPEIFLFTDIFHLQNVGDLPLLVLRAGEGQIKQAKQMGGRCVQHFMTLNCTILHHPVLYCSALHCAIRCTAVF